MENCKESEDQRRSFKKKEFEHGINNWIFLFFWAFLINFVIENYLRYGIVKTPLDITYCFSDFVQENYLLYILLFICYLMQVLICYITEKCLALKILPEKVGIVLHIFNVLLLVNCSAYLFNYYKFNRIAAAAVALCCFIPTIKLISYVMINTKRRKIYFEQTLEIEKRNQEDNTKTTIGYRQSVSLKNILIYVTCTGNGNYDTNLQQNRPRNYRKLFYALIKLIIIHYIMAFIIYQYILPEVGVTIFCYNAGQYLKMFGTVMKLALPTNIVWFLYYYYLLFEIALPSFGWIGGTEEIVVAKNWWNSEHITMFWNKWNYQTHILFKQLFFLPALKMGYSKMQAAFLVAFVTGFLHEYLVSVPCRTGYGLTMLAMISQIPLSYITRSIAERYGANYGNFLVWLTLVTGELIVVVGAYYEYAKEN